MRADTHFPISGVAVPIPLSPPISPDPPPAASGLSRPWSGARVQRSRKLLHRARKGREGERTSRMTPPNTAPLRVPPRVCSSLETMYSVKRKRTIKVFKAVKPYPVGVRFSRNRFSPLTVLSGVILATLNPNVLAYSYLLHSTLSTRCVRPYLCTFCSAGLRIARGSGLLAENMTQTAVETAATSGLASARATQASHIARGRPGESLPRCVFRTLRSLVPTAHRPSRSRGRDRHVFYPPQSAAPSSLCAGHGRRSRLRLPLACFRMSWPSSQTRQTLPPTPALELLLSVRPEIRPREELLESDVHPESVFATTCRHPVARQPHSNIAALCKRTLRSARARHIK